MSDDAPQAGRRLVWEITDDGPATHRFAERPLPPDGGPGATFVVGRSDPRTDWPRIQPGPLDAHGGFRGHSATVVFAVAPADVGGWHVLELQARERSGPCPSLRVELNGRSALIVTRGVRQDRAHDPIPPSPVAGLIDRELWIPPGILVAGENALVLTTIALDAPAADELVPARRPDAGSWFGSTLQWMRLALCATKSAPPAPVVRVELLPLFVRRPGETRLRECADVVVENLPSHADTSLEITIGDHREVADVASYGYDFGDARVRLEVPEPDGAVDADVRVVAAGSAPTRVTRRCTPARKWTLHLIPHVHFDLGYTDRQAKVVELHNRNVDKALRILGTRPDWRFAIDAAVVVKNHLRSRDDATGARAVAALRAGQLGMNAFWALPLTGVMGLEDLHRSLYFAAALRRGHDVPVRAANITDVPSYTWAVPSVLASAGIDAFMGIVNHMRGGNADSDVQHLRSPVRWIGPDGRDVLAFFADSYIQLRYLCADPPTIAGAAQGLSRFAGRYDRADYLAHDLPIMGTHTDNEDLSHGYADLVERWNAAYVWPRLRYSTVADYLAAVEPLRDRLPVMYGDGGSYWEDGVGTQAAVTASMRDTQALLPGIEAVTALVAARSGGPVPHLDALDAAWESLLVATEHTFTGSTATSRPDAELNADQLAWTRAHVERARLVAGDEGLRALSQLADLVHTDTVPAILVVNPGSWQRDLVVDLQVEDGTVVQDPDGKPLDQLATAPAADGLVDVRVLVPAVPAFGYRLLSLVRAPAGDGAGRPVAQPVPAAFETPFYRVTVEPATGRVVSLVHKELQLDLLDAAARHGLGEVLYVSGGDTARGLEGATVRLDSLYDYDPELPAAVLDVTPATMRGVELRRTPWGYVLRAEGSAPTIPVAEVELELFDDTDRVEVIVTLEKEPCRRRESVYVAFPFAPRLPAVRYQRQLGWVNPASDHYAGACNEWLATEAAVLVGDPRLTVAWATADAPLFTVSDIVRGRWPTTFSAQNGSLMSWVMNNHWWTNTPADQSGRVRLRYAFAPVRDGDLAAAARLGRELRQRPMVAELRATDRCDSDPRPLPPSGQLYRPAEAENVVTTMFPGRAGAQFTMRLQEVAGAATTVHVGHPAPWGDGGGRAWAARCTATEDVVEDLELDADGRVVVDLRPYEVRTLCFGIA